jgi:hypothetical protein
MKRILAISYSQSGQLHSALQSFLEPFSKDESCEVIWKILAPCEPYPFPWSIARFFDVFPETVCGVPQPLEPLDLKKDEKFDIIVLAYQVWYLSPSLPIRSFLETEEARSLFSGTRVVTLVACRNMWYEASMIVKKCLASVNARHIGHVAVIDQGPAWSTFLTTPYWLLTGKRTFLKSVFPPAGVSEADIRKTAGYGQSLSAFLLENSAENQKKNAPFVGLQTYTVNKKYVIPEWVGRALFVPWAKFLFLLTRPGSFKRKLLLVPFVLSLISAILIVLPLVILGRLLLYPFVNPVVENYIQKLKVHGE